jgi:beta-glucanase (GH16 family)
LQGGEAIVNFDKIKQKCLYSLLVEFHFKKGSGKSLRKLSVFLAMLIFGVVPAHALPPAAEGYVLVWSDEFNGTSLDTTAWDYARGQNYTNSISAYYTRANLTVENGSLVIWSRHDDHGYPYTSGRIFSADKHNFKYGYFECRMITPAGQVSGPGLWSYVLLLGDSFNHGVPWPTCGEIDLYYQRPSNAVVQANGYQPVPATIGDNEFFGTCFFTGVNGGPSYHACQHNYSTCLCDHYHTYALLWDSSHVEYYFDDTLYWGQDFPIVNDTNFGTPSTTQSTNWNAFHSPMYWMIDVALGGSYQGQNINNAIFPTKMLIDYVRVYQKDAVGVVSHDIRRQKTLHSFALVNPATALLTVYDLSGKLVADYSGRVRRMKKGDNALKIVPSALSNGAYVVKLIDKGVPASRMMATAR